MSNSLQKVDNINPFAVDHQEAERYEVLVKHFERARYHYPGINEEGQELPIIDLAKLETHLESDIEAFPEEERELIRLKRRALIILRGNLSWAKRKAFGDKNSKNIEEYTLNDKEDELLELFSRFHSIDEVIKIINVEWGLPVTMKSLALFRERNSKRIKEGQEAFKESIDDLRLVHKRSRLEESVWLYNKVKSKIDLTGSMDAIKEAGNILNNIKKEVEGDKITIEGNIQMDIKQTIDLHTQQEILGSIPLMQIIIGRVSAKQGINPEFMINRLIKSSYAKFSGFGGASMDEMRTAEIFLPSQMANYNFEKILEGRKALEEEESKSKVIDITPLRNPDKVSNKRNKLLDLINSKKSEVGSKSDSVNNSGKG